MTFHDRMNPDIDFTKTRLQVHRRVRSFFGGEVHFKLEWALFQLAVRKIHNI